MGVLLAFYVTRWHPPGMRSNGEERCHPLAADFPGHSRYTERCWMRSRRVHAAWGVWGKAKDSRLPHDVHGAVMKLAHHTRITEQFSAIELLPHAANLSCTNTKENWDGKPNPPNDSNRSPSLPRRHARRSDRRPAPAHRRHALSRQGDRRRCVAGRAAGDAPRARALLGNRLRLPEARFEAERAAAVHDEDRRDRHPLHSREVASRARAAADHHAR